MSLALGHIPRLEQLPQTVEIISVHLDQSNVVHDAQVLVVGLHCAHCPVERAGDQVFVVDQDVLVVHVGVRVGVGLTFDTVVAESLYVAPLLLHALVVTDHTDLTPARMCGHHSIS
jgi:hypothetical protein